MLDRIKCCRKSTPDASSAPAPVEKKDNTKAEGCCRGRTVSCWTSTASTASSCATGTASRGLGCLRGVAHLVRRGFCNNVRVCQQQVVLASDEREDDSDSEPSATKGGENSKDSSFEPKKTGPESSGAAASVAASSSPASPAAAASTHGSRPRHKRTQQVLPLTTYEMNGGEPSLRAPSILLPYGCGKKNRNFKLNPTYLGMGLTVVALAALLSRFGYLNVKY